ncbi:hypothetical protein NMY22_g14980 [Coprinellus aureogranulatus]|nr:hypothetical protein NMY22_g14980 [Coprinellus aureogranulatus]
MLWERVRIPKPEGKTRGECKERARTIHIAVDRAAYELHRHLSLGFTFQEVDVPNLQSSFWQTLSLLRRRARAGMAGMTKEEEAPEEPILDSGISLIPDDASAGFLPPAHSLQGRQLRQRAAQRGYRSVN